MQEISQVIDESMKVMGYDLSDQSQGINELIQEVTANETVNSLVEAMQINKGSKDGVKASSDGEVKIEEIKVNKG
jgi:hypothetical protein